MDIAVNGIVKKFGSFTALDHLDLTVESGSVHGFLGPNGSGKSTTIRTLLGLYRRESGQVTVLGQDPATSADAINRKVAYVPGDVALWPNLTGMQCLDALASMRGARDAARESLLIERFALDPSKRVRTYSRGNRQKVALIAALSAPVKLLLLDEPTSGLDPLMEQAFRETIAEAQGSQQTVLLSSHILSEVQSVCTDVTIIREGRTVESGSLAQMRHLAAREIRARGPKPQLTAFFLSLTSSGASPTREGDDVVVKANDSDVPHCLALAIDAGLSDITCTPASLEDLFLRHYEADVR